MFRTGYNSDPDKDSLEFATIVEGESLTQQCFLEDCSIQTMVERYAITGILPSGPTPIYGDFLDAPTDLMTVLEIVRQADEAFSTLDAKTRERFANDPNRLVEFLSDPANRSEAEKLGLVAPKAPIVAPKAPIDQPPEAADGGGSTDTT